MQDSMSTIVQFCPIPIYKGKVKLNQKDIDNFLLLKMKRLKGDDGFQSENTKILFDEKFQDVRKQVESHLNFFVHDFLKIRITMVFELQNSWVMKHLPGDYALEHFHENSIFSGVLYLKVDENSGAIIFQKNRMWENLFPRSLGLEIEEYNNFNCNQWNILPEIEDIIIFPSHLTHRVAKNLSKNNRYCVAFNFFPRGQLGAPGSLLELKL